MTARVPSSHVPLTEAVIRATWAWQQDKLMAAGVTQEEVATYLRWFFAFMRVAASRPRPRHEKLKGIPVNFDPADVKAAEETDEVKSIRAKRAGIPDEMDAAYGRLRDMLATGQLPGFVVTEDGRMHRLEPWRWNGEDADTAHQRGQMRTARGPNAIIGVAAIPGRSWRRRSAALL